MRKRNVISDVIAKKRNCLTLKKKVEVINYAKKNPQVNITDLGEIIIIIIIIRNLQNIVYIQENKN